ncbi:MAG: hypothetical protein KJ674_03580 [Nanoarchaeota archaeon]|nr:hypothetical protein [Nanoarchaeota archaeon]
MTFKFFEYLPQNPLDLTAYKTDLRMGGLNGLEGLYVIYQNGEKIAFSDTPQNVVNKSLDSDILDRDTVFLIKKVIFSEDNLVQFRPQRLVINRKPHWET